jgi:hypothetical protein
MHRHRTARVSRLFTVLVLAILAVLYVGDTAVARDRLTIEEKLARVRLPAPPVAYVVPGSSERCGEGVGAALETATICMGGLSYLPAFVRAHEHAHLLDHQVFTGADRRRLVRLMGMPPEAAERWLDRATGVHGAESPGEWLADYYATIATAGSGDEYASYAPRISRRRLLRIARSLERLGRRHRLAEYRYADPFEQGGSGCPRRLPSGVICGGSSA